MVAHGYTRQPPRRAEVYAPEKLPTMDTPERTSDGEMKGEVALGRYVVDGLLAMGALCEVVHAHDPEGRPVVVKKLHRHCAHDPTLAAMIQHEARVLRALDHPALPRVVAHGCDKGVWFVVEERVPGKDLAAITAHTPTQALEAGVQAVRQVLLALDHAHTRRDGNGALLEIVHRDVAPANVIVGEDGRVTLVDWGLATSVWRPDPDRGRMKGTRGYMAPEVVTGACDADARSDLFAVGVVLYELTVGKRLYPGGLMEVMAAIADGPVHSPKDAVPGYPPALDAVVRRALARSPDERYGSAAAMASALDEAANAAGIPMGTTALAQMVSRAGTREG